MRVVLDPNILIAALLSPRGAPAEILTHWLEGSFDLVVSEALLDELAQALTYPKLRTRIAVSDADDLMRLLRRSAIVRPDPPDAPRRSTDPGDDYLLALAEAERALLVSGDRHLLELADRYPIHGARRFLERHET